MNDLGTAALNGRLVAMAVIASFAPGAEPAASERDAAGSAPERTPFSVYRTFEEMVKATEPVLPPVRAVTRGPKFHWFGYYDKDQLDASGRFVLLGRLCEPFIPKGERPA